MPIVLKSGNLNVLEPSGPVQACNGIALPLPFMKYSIVSCTSYHHDITRKKKGHLTAGQLSVIHNKSERAEVVTMIDHSMVVQTPWNTVGHTETNSKVHRPYMTLLSCKLMLWQNVKILTPWSLHPYYLWQGSTNLRCQVCQRAAHWQLFDNLDNRGFVSCSHYLTTCLCRSKELLFWKQNFNVLLKSPTRV